MCTCVDGEAPGVRKQSGAYLSLQIPASMRVCPRNQTRGNSERREYPLRYSTTGSNGSLCKALYSDPSATFVAFESAPHWGRSHRVRRCQAQRLADRRDVAGKVERLVEAGEGELDEAGGQQLIADQICARPLEWSRAAGHPVLRLFGVDDELLDGLLGQMKAWIVFTSAPARSRQSGARPPARAHDCWPRWRSSLRSRRPRARPSRPWLRWMALEQSEPCCPSP